MFLTPCNVQLELRMVDRIPCKCTMLRMYHVSMQLSDSISRGVHDPLSRVSVANYYQVPMTPQVSRLHRVIVHACSLCFVS